MNASLIGGASAPAAGSLFAALERYLRGRGHDVRRRDDREAALADLAAAPDDLVFLDLGDAVAAGLDWCRRLRSKPETAWCVLIVVAAEFRPLELEQAIRAGADDYLLRADPDEVIALRLALAEHRSGDRAARRSALHALSCSETRLRDLLETAPDAMLRIDQEGLITVLNEQAERLTGYRRDELIGRPIELLVPPTRREAHVPLRQRFFERPTTRPMGSTLDLWLRRKDGSDVAVDVCLGHHRDDGVPYAVAAVRDVSERRRMEQELRQARQAAEQAYHRIRQELEVAARIQRSLLPARPPQVAGVRLAWRYLPCAEVGGDGLGVFALDESRLGVYLLDVSGHGVAAALLSVALARQLPPQNNDRAGEPAEVALRLNRWLMADRANEQFFTMVYGVLDVRSLAFRYVSAGHPDLLRVGAGGEASFDPGQAIPIGVRRDVAFPEQSLQLRRGDVLMLYSDGIIESQDAGKRLFGQERLRQCVSEAVGRGTDACVDRVLDEVQAWARGNPHDDVSILAVGVGTDEG